MYALQQLVHGVYFLSGEALQLYEVRVFNKLYIRENILKLDLPSEMHWRRDISRYKLYFLRSL